MAEVHRLREPSKADEHYGRILDAECRFLDLESSLKILKGVCSLWFDTTETAPDPAKLDALHFAVDAVEEQAKKTRAALWPGKS